MASDIPKQYEPATIEQHIYDRWLAAKAFAASPDERLQRYVIMMPLPNVTGALHMGHAMDNVMQDLLTRWHRMMGDNTLWMPGTDHAGIATQAVIEKRLLELEGQTRHDVGREGLVQRIWDWKDQYQKRIISQQQAMGCSCDWDRQRFTMDDICARAVRWTFFRMFQDGLIFRGNRLVNWDCQLQTAVSDDEIVYETVQGHFYYLRYPVIDPQPGEPAYVVVATTRPETMLGDTAVACHPDPAGALAASLEETRHKLEHAPVRERAALEEELSHLERRRETHLPTLLTLVQMARYGRQIRLPLLDRVMPLICDEWAKPQLGSGCVKITPAHDPNDYAVWTRHQQEIESINILHEDGSLNANAGPYAGLDRFVARQWVVDDLRTQGLLEAMEERAVEVGHSDRSKTPIEPYLSKQWFVRMGDIEGGIVCGRGTTKEFVAPGLAQAAMDAAQGRSLRSLRPHSGAERSLRSSATVSAEGPQAPSLRPHSGAEAWHSPTGRKVTFHPDPVRYGNTYLQWLAEKRDWCISRQLWWGHRIPIWAGTYAGQALQQVVTALAPYLGRADLCARLTWADGTSQLLHPDGLGSLSPREGLRPAPTQSRQRAGGEGPQRLIKAPHPNPLPEGRAKTPSADTVAEEGKEGARQNHIDNALDTGVAAEGVEVLVCLRDAQAESALGPGLTALGLVQDPDVLDTWFSSGLWPMSTLGWPDPETAVVNPGQAPLGQQNGYPNCLEYYYPGSCLVTGRDIITLWVVRMVLMGLYNMGDVPFTDVFIHANILDGKGERMSKSKGNGVDPVDIIERYGTDAMRYVLCDMQTGMQDIRLPVQAISPYTGELVDLATARHGRSIFTYVCPTTGQEFDVLGSMPEVPAAKLISDRFEVGRNFCNKLLNAARFALMHLEDVTFTPRQYQELADEDRWILSRLAHAVATVHGHLEAYNPAAALSTARDFFWSELCDWYLEFIKPRLRDAARAPLARQVLAVTIDQVLRLLHPFVPYITEALWEPLNAQAPVRGIDAPLPASELLIQAAWPTVHPAWRDTALEAHMTFLQEVVRAIRDLRSKYTISPHARVPVRMHAAGEAAATLRAWTDLLTTMAGLESVEIAPDMQRSPDAATAVVGQVEVYMPGVIDVDKERGRLTKQREQLLGRLEGSQRKLANADFLRKASPEVVQKERDRLTECASQIENVEATLAALG